MFEGARCYDTPRGSACFQLDAHMRRLFDSAKIYRMEPQVDRPTLTAAVLETIRANAFKACYIRPIVYRGYNTLGVDPSACPVDSAILTWEWGAYLGKEALERGADVAVSSWTRAAANTFPSLAKSSANYANSQLIKMSAIADGYSEGIALDTAGYLSEGSGQNLFLVRDEILYTPPVSAAILPGITRNSVITHRAGSRLPGARGTAARASCSTSPTRRSSSARRSRSRRSDRSTRSSSATAAADRSPRRSRARSSTSSTASGRTPTAG